MDAWSCGRVCSCHALVILYGKRLLRVWMSGSRMELNGFGLELLNFDQALLPAGNLQRNPYYSRHLESQSLEVSFKRNL